MHEHYDYKRAKEKGLRRILLFIGLGIFFSCSDAHLGGSIEEIIEEQRGDRRRNEVLNALKKEEKKEKEEEEKGTSKGGNGGGGGGGSSVLDVREGISKEERIEGIKALEEEIKALEEEKERFLVLREVRQGEELEEIREVLQRLLESLKRGEEINPLQLEKIRRGLSKASLGAIHVELGSINAHMKRLEEEAKRNR